MEDEPGDAVSLRRLAVICGVSMSTVKRRHANSRLPEAFLHTQPGGRRQWVVAEADVEQIAKREGWKTDRRRDDLDALTLDEARTLLHQNRKELRKAAQAINTERRRAERLSRQLEDTKRLLAISQEHRRREQALADLHNRQRPAAR